MNYCLNVKCYSLIHSQQHYSVKYLQNIHIQEIINIINSFQVPTTILIIFFWFSFIFKISIMNRNNKEILMLRVFVMLHYHIIQLLQNMLKELRITQLRSQRIGILIIIQVNHLKYTQSKLNEQIQLICIMLIQN